jgi:hypothetical protein
MATASRRVAVPRGLGSARRMDASAWGAIALVAGFIAVTAWWLSIDRSVQYNDAGQHLYFAFGYHDALSKGTLLRAIGAPSFYPPGTYLLGGLATLVGGVSIATPILAQNLVYVPLLAVACYQLGRMLAGPTAGLLAVLFALGAPLIIEQFHVFMLDIPQTAFAAATVWLILASGRFGRVGVAALAGVTMGLGIVTKELAPVYVVGVVVCVLARGGWRNWRGLLTFIVVALLVGTPWYVQQVIAGYGSVIFDAAGGGRDVPPAAHPPLASLANLAWYFWATLDGLLFAPLFLLATAGVGVAVARVARTREEADPTLELLCGLCGAWVLLTVMPHHDMRYTMGFVVFLAVLGTAWIVRLAPAPRTLAIVLLVGAIGAAHVGATLGVGAETTRRLPGNRRAAYGEGVPPRGRVIVYSNNDYMVSRPHPHPDVLGLFTALRREGMTSIEWDDQVERWDRYFADIGLLVFARVANLVVIPEAARTPALTQGQAALIRAWTIGGAGPPCLRLGDGSGVWAHIGTLRQIPQAYCPAELSQRVN